MRYDLFSVIHDLSLVLDIVSIHSMNESCVTHHILMTFIIISLMAQKTEAEGFGDVSVVGEFGRRVREDLESEDLLEWVRRRLSR